MKDILVKFFILVFFASPSYLLAQNENWAADSLSIYDRKIHEKLSQDEYEEVDSLFKILYDRGASSLNPAIYDYFYKSILNPKIQQEAKLLAGIQNNLGNLEFYRSDFEAAKNAFTLALANYQKAGMRESAAGMAMNLGIIQERASNYDSALAAYNQALPIFQELKDTAGVASVLENIGLAYSYQGSYKLALNYMEQADSVLKTNTPLTSGRWTNLYYNKTTIYNSLGEYREALFYALKGLKLSEDLKDERRINLGYIMLEDTYDKLEDQENWLKYVKLAKVFAEKSENGLRNADLDFKLARYYLDKEIYDSASYYSEKGLAYYSENNYGEGLTRGYILRGKIFFSQKEYQKAIQEYQLALKHMNNEESRQIASVSHNLGISYSRIGNYNKADEYLNQALSYRLDFGQKSTLAPTYLALSESNLDRGNYKNAYEYYTKYKAYEDSILDETKTKQIAELQTEYETEKKDQAIVELEQESQIQHLLAAKQKSHIYLSLAGIALLLIIILVFFYRARLKQKANLQLAIKNAEIAKQNDEKELLLKEIHHRVKNNLQIISSLLSMQTRGVKDLKVIDAMKESQSRVKTMALIHEKLYQYENLSSINMQEYMKQLSEFLTQTYGKNKEVEVIIQAEEINLDIDTAVPLGLITNELLSNALKYAFEGTETGKIEISLNRTESKDFKLVISDSGKGIDKDLDIEKTSSLGLRLVRTLTRQINGNLSFQSHPGTTFSIIFPEETLAA
ncbi:tetratricopeptide repeat-containing sensor histidine kinase [Algoriphagus chordae]|uniref:Two-component sensor histidine kinase n=1 Tax=Algoriphagus chordae TaxID=237019 RepID=A0A2W7QGC1_9BACT|nr:histidine kinase dimerization/phosphoacceptor domain -containing protein [Algoriphagus chordae]PZX47578.1 two-component sensor histidine kinase [Algoriphagus chordae]